MEPMTGLDGYLPFPKRFATDAIHHEQEPDKWNFKSVAVPIFNTTTFKQSAPGVYEKFDYSRSGNPTRQVLENVLAKLDNGKYGLTFSSGLAATNTLFSMLKAGDHIVVGDDIYGGTFRLFSKVAAKFNIEATYVDLTDISNLSKSIKPNTKLIWVETPTNPTLKVVDIKAAAKIAKENNIILTVDNTFLTSYLQRPLDLGADIVLYSLTKFMNGHADIVMGAMITSNKEIYDQLAFLQNAIGSIPSPTDCYQVNRSLKTLALRMQQHVRNSLVVANFLEAHPKVEKVLHPGLSSHPQHKLFKSQTCGHSGVFSFYLKGNLQSSVTFLSSLRVIILAESLGGFESLAELPAVMTHSSVPPEQRKLLGITDTLIRISVGLEDSEDLIADLDQALRKIP